jgi:hypothetical protein
MQWSAVTWRGANPISWDVLYSAGARIPGTVEAVHPVFRWDVASGAAGGFIGRQPVTFTKAFTNRDGYFLSKSADDPSSVLGYQLRLLDLIDNIDNLC